MSESRTHRFCLLLSEEELSRLRAKAEELSIVNRNGRPIVSELIRIAFNRLLEEKEAV